MTWLTVYVLGYIWWPNDVLCATEYQCPSDVQNEYDAEYWLSTHSGDFSGITAYAIRKTHEDVDHNDELGRACMCTTETWLKEMSEDEWKDWRDCVTCDA